MANLPELLTAIEREACKSSLFEFVKSFWGVIIPETPVFNWHIPYLCEELEKLSYYIVNRLEKPYDLLINIPPGTTKSTLVTIFWPVWLWTQDPTIRTITNTYSEDLSVEFATKSRDIIQSDKFRRLFPEIKLRRDKSGKQSYENTKTGARYTTSTGGTITGKHAHLIISDDPQNPKQAESDTLRKTANDHTKTLSSRKVDKRNTPTVTIMQRLHENDVTGYILSRGKENVRHICLPAEASAMVKPAELKEKYIDGLLDPVRLSRAVLDEARLDLGSRAYSGQYDQNPIPDGGNIVKKEWFPRISRAEFERIRGYEPYIFFADTAYTSDRSNDPTGIIATCKIENKIYIVNGKKLWLDFPDLCRFIVRWTAENGYNNESSIRIEPKASGLSTVQTLQRTTGLNITITDTPRDDKKTRLSAASPTIECGRVVLVDDFFTEEFVEEVCGFPAKEHDEYVDILAYAVDYYNNVEEESEPQDLDDFFN